MDANDFLMGGGGKSAKFPTPGTIVSGQVARPPIVQQQTDMKTNKPETWPSGDPKMQLVVQLQTAERDPADPEDDGIRALYVKGKSLTDAVRSAVRTSGAKGLEVGGTLTVQYTGDGEQQTKGFDPPKLYSASYVPAPAAAAQQFLGTAQPAAPAAPQQHVPPAQPQYAPPVPAPAPVYAPPVQPQPQYVAPPAPVTPAPVAAPVAAAIPPIPPGLNIAPEQWAAMAPMQRDSVLAALGMAAAPAPMPPY